MTEGYTSERSYKKRPSLSSSSAVVSREGSAGGVKRMAGVCVEKPIVYGTVAFWLGKKADPKKTHSWTAFVRGPNNENIGQFIKKVVFHLHASFEKPKRVVDKPPFEITETGWGEFEIGVRITFVDPNEKPIDLYFPLRLFPPEGVQQVTKKPVVAELYDDIVFNEPTESFYKKLMKTPTERNPGQPIQITPHPLAEAAGVQPAFNEQGDLKKLQEASKKVQADIARLRAQYEAAEKESAEIEAEIKRLQEEKKTKDSAVPMEE
eukprot:TRINITY_DN12891_c0_g1_i1.p1 TRINITY_DN12891_c0_g1~~TRINITY_DN12891_c0_g1_i1.p1  ORF type:complete len:264 (-),score=87.13 TRINITY_DN12891_c0_g1_i1:80-871(-)